ncbi:MAG: hypothetical protein ABR874_13330 [Candidatus Sulfotelmatobacter sp.]|jgi:hypothetical protein
MKLVGVIGTGILSLTLGATALAYPQEQRDQQEENKDKPAQEEKKAQPEKPAKQDEKNARQEEKNTRPEEKNAQEHSQEAKPGKQEEHAQANGGGRIPADKYKANFGREHTFRVTAGDYQNHRFRYGGYWFGFGQPWPSNWLYTQDVYVVEIDGVYYLCNASYPGVNLMLNVTL